MSTSHDHMVYHGALMDEYLQLCRYYNCEPQRKVVVDGMTAIDYEGLHAKTLKALKEQEKIAENIK